MSAFQTANPQHGGGSSRMRGAATIVSVGLNLALGLVIVGLKVAVAH